MSANDAGLVVQKRSCDRVNLASPNGSDRELWKSRFARTFGYATAGVQQSLVDQLCRLYIQGKEGKTAEILLNRALATVHAIAPNDPLEAMLAVQMVATQKVAMEQLRLANIPEQPYEIANRCTNRATRLMRLFTTQLDALQRYRGKGPTEQVVRVEHVTVKAGAQAVIGSVTMPPKGDRGDGGNQQMSDHPMNRAPRCAAKNRAGIPCRAPAMKNGRCQLHVGHSLSGVNSPTYRHGYYTREAMAQRKEIGALLARSAVTIQQIGEGRRGRRRP
jgi:hypothetical protein